MSGGPIRVVVFNDSPTMRAVLRSVAAASPDLVVVAEVESGADAAAVVERADADVVVMDVVMPGVDGYQATRDIMRERPTPIVMVSAVLDPSDQEVVFAALEAGALHIAEPPPAPGSHDHVLRWAAFAELLRTIAGAHPERLETGSAGAAQPAAATPRNDLAAIGIVASAGGPQAVSALLSELPPGVLPPILLVQHLAPGFSVSYASWLAEVSGHDVGIASAGAPARRGCVYLAPDGQHIGLDDEGCLTVTSEAPVDGFRPSGTVLLRKLARLGRRAVAVVLSGMGRDGAAGVVSLVDAGGRVVAQSRATAALEAMPAAALATGAVEAELPIAEIGRWLRERSGLQ